MTMRTSFLLLCVVAASGCGRNNWPAPPPVDEAKYRQDYAEMTKAQRETAEYALSLVGVWSLEEGDTPFGADPAQPIVLPATAVAPHAGVLRRSGDSVTVIPERGVPVTREDGAAVTSGAEPPVVLGSVHIEAYPVPPAVFVDARDTNAPALKDIRIDTFPIDAKWRVPARFDAFAHPKTIKIATTRGTVNEASAVGELVFRLNGREFKLTTLGEPDSDQFFVMFKDDTNGRTTFSGYRMLSPKAVKNGEWTVLDFNFASNPPCAYSKFTMCPLPPKENRLAMAVEAGVKRDPMARGYSE
jgi:uncharacterized protein (DUF1684 family)